jgi:flagellar basal-body rod protein FlgG
MLAEMARTDVISNNMANVNTTAFKKDRTIFRAFPEMNIHRIHDPVPAGLDKVVDPRPFIGMMGTGVMLDEVNTDFNQGHLITTSNPLDLAIRGEGFFQVQTPEGIRYTRDGSFSLSSNGYLVTKEGYYVLGENGPLQLLQTGDITISQQGEVFVNDEYIDRLNIVTFADLNQLQKQGDNLYFTDAVPEPLQDADVVQGALEGSNISIVAEMVDLISAFRAYEANQKVIQTHDTTLDRAINDVGRI